MNPFSAFGGGRVKVNRTGQLVADVALRSGQNVGRGGDLTKCNELDAAGHRRLPGVAWGGRAVP